MVDNVGGVGYTKSVPSVENIGGKYEILKQISWTLLQCEKYKFNMYACNKF